MPRTVVAVVVSCAACLVACGETRSPLGPAETAVSTSTSAFVMPALLARQVLMLDACDPDSFNAALGPGTCSRPTSGGIPFPTFVDLLEKHQRVDAWRFSPDVIAVTRPTTLTIPNNGGIPHSFTEVAEFGGGFVPFLNQLSGNPVPAPECVHPMIPTAPNPAVNLVPPGAAGEITVNPGEAKKYMCCIHPWMRAETR